MARSISKNRIVRTIFTRLAPYYDRLDALVTGKRGGEWRRLAAELPLPRPPRRILDACTGTGLMAMEMMRKYNHSRVIGVDFCPAMVSIARQRIQALHLGRRIEARVENVEIMPFADGFFDAVVVAFGMRFVSDVRVVLRECNRVLQPGGMLMVLEFGQPANPLRRRWVRWRREHWLPVRAALGLRVPRTLMYPLHDALAYYPDPETFGHLLGKTGFRDVAYLNLAGGTATLHRAVKHVSSR